MNKAFGKITLNLFAIGLLVVSSFFITDSALSAQKTVVIDPGHGSAANSREYEGKRELAIALKLKAKLEQKGYKVVLTHSSIGASIGGARSEKDDNIARASIANSNKSDLSIRLHSDDRSDDRFVILYPDQAAKDPYGFSGPQDKSIIPKSKTAASTVSSSLSKSGYTGSAKGETVGFRNGGQIQTFSAHSSYPGITLELYGHNSASLRDKYASTSEQDKVAEALAAGISSYLGSSGSQTSNSSSNNPTTNQTPSGELLANADPKCPTKPPEAGPSTGSDYQAQVAQAFMHQQNVAAGTSFDSFETTDAGNVPQYTGTPSQYGPAIVKVAQSQLGKKYNDDHTPYQAYTINGTRAWAWCVAFVTWVYNEAGAKVERSGGTSRIMEVFPPPHQSISNPAKKGISPMPGDAFIVYSAYSDTGRHAGLVESVSGSTVYTIEGNNSQNSVARNKRSVSELLWIGRW